MLNVIYYSLYDSLWFDAVHAGIVATAAFLLAVDAARPTLKGYLYGIVFRLSPTHEAGVRVCCSPDADNRSACQRGQVHIGRIH